MRTLACILLASIIVLSLALVQSERTQINLVSTTKDDATCEPCGTNCWNCYTLDETLIRVNQSQHSIDVHIKLKTCSLKSIAHLQNVSDITILAQEPATIECEKSAGLAFFDSSDIRLENLTFISCGMEQYSTSRDLKSITDQFIFITFHSSVYFLSCRDVTVKHVVIKKSPGTAMALYNTAGKNHITSSTFSDNGYGEDIEDQYGGGVIIEHSPQVPGDVKTCKTPNHHEISNAQFAITDSVFDSNFAGATDYAPLHITGGNDYIGFGKGGGLSIVFRGTAQNNSVSLSTLKFINNTAQFGGSLFVGFFDDTISNVVIFEESTVNSSDAFVSLDHICVPQTIAAEGGGAMIMYGATGNSFAGESLTFANNTALSNGGSLSVHSTIMSNYTSQHQPSSLHLQDLTVQGSSAKIGAGAYFISHYSSSTQIETKVTSSKFTSNGLQRMCLSPGTTPCSATVYASNFPLHLNGRTTFTDNDASGLEIHGSSVTFDKGSETTFERNRGENGGGIIIADCGKILVDSKADVMFSQNRAVYHGGGIYHSGCSEFYLNYPVIGPKDCFIEHVNGSLLFKDTEITITFDNNTAGEKVNAIHTEALLSCIDSQGNQVQEINNVFCGWNFRPVGYNCTSQVSSGVLYMEVKLPSDNLRVFPGQMFNVTINAYDAYQDRVFERVEICVHEGQGSLYETSSVRTTSCMYDTLTSSGEVPVTLFSLVDKEKCDTYANKTVVLSVKVLSSPYPQAFASVKIIPCPIHTKFKCPKCYLDVDQSHGVACANPEYCSLDDSPSSANCPLTYSLKISKVHCWNFLTDVNSSTSVLSQFIGGECPYNYRTEFCEQISDITFQSQPAPCPAHRTGRLCGRCDGQHGIAINTGDMECISCHPKHVRSAERFITFSYVSIQLIYGTILFLLIILMKLSLNAGGTNAFIFYCQVMTMKYPGLSYPSWVLEKNYDDTYKYSTARGFTVIYSIANLDFITPFAEPFCLSQELTPIHAITLEYVPALYLLLLTFLVYVWVILYKNQCNPILSLTNMMIRKGENPNPRPYCRYTPNYFQSLALIALLCYTRIATTTVKFLHSTDYYNLQGNNLGTAFFYDGTLDYFGEGHLLYAIMAVLVLAFIIFLPALLLLFYPICAENCCERPIYTIHLQSFNGCFKDGTKKTRDHRYFAGVYLILRIIVAFLYLERDIETLLVSQISVAIIAASMFMTVRPYKTDIFNTIDGLLFVYLALLSGLSANGYYSICQKFLIHIPLMIVILYALYRVLLSGIQLRRNGQYRTGNDNADLDGGDEPLLNPEEHGDFEGAFAHRLLNPQDYSVQKAGNTKRMRVPLMNMSS